MLVEYYYKRRKRCEVVDATDTVVLDGTTVSKVNLSK
jgi:hypothetical protein